jgi:uncharacterized protein (TIGR02996 family)
VSFLTVIRGNLRVQIEANPMCQRVAQQYFLKIKLQRSRSPDQIADDRNRLDQFLAPDLIRQAGQMAEMFLPLTPREAGRAAAARACDRIFDCSLFSLSEAERIQILEETQRRIAAGETVFSVSATGGAVEEVVLRLPGLWQSLLQRAFNLHPSWYNLIGFILDRIGNNFDFPWIRVSLRQAMPGPDGLPRALLEAVHLRLKEWLRQVLLSDEISTIVPAGGCEAWELRDLHAGRPNLLEWVRQEQRDSISEQGTAILNAIEMHPDDPSSRSVYADFLDDEEEPARAKAVRGELCREAGRRTLEIACLQVDAWLEHGPETRVPDDGLTAYVSEAILGGVLSICLDRLADAMVDCYHEHHSSQSHS